MKLFGNLLMYLISFAAILFCQYEPLLAKATVNYYGARDPRIQYTGRIDFSNPDLPRFYASGVYITLAFSGNTCEISLNDELLYEKNHNYVSIIIDDQPVKRIKLTAAKNVLKLGENLSKGTHLLRICKGTESGIGFLEFVGIRCEKLLTPQHKPLRKIEFIGNSITSGTGSDLTIPCGSTADWYDQHNAYMSYGPLTARSLNAQWHLTSVSGIGLMQSCCKMKITMPDVYDKINLRENTLDWDFSKYQPDVVTICLGQNDGIQDSVLFCGAYVSFLNKLKAAYPKTSLICITSPMADDKLLAVQKRYINGVVSYMNAAGSKNVHAFFFSQHWKGGCGGHPNLAEHKNIATELSVAIKKIKNWR
jgi:hypothetical protein